MVLVRALGWLLLAFATAVVVNDLLVWWSEGGFRFTSLGDLWTKLDPGSLGSAQAGVQRFASASLWNWAARPILITPAIVLFLGFGLLLLWAGSRAGDRPEPGFVMGSRPPRRRRRGGLS